MTQPLSSPARPAAGSAPALAEAPFREMIASLRADLEREHFSERQEAERELRESNAALENAVEGISQLDTAGRYVAANPAYTQMLGCTPAEIIGTSWTATVHPGDIDRVQAAFHLMLDRGKGDAEVRGVRTDGSGFWKHVMMVKAHDKEGRHAGHYCFARDITARRAAEEKSHEQARLLDLAHDAIIVRDFATRKITFWNQGAERLYGWTRAEALGKSVSELLFRDPDAVDAVSEELLATGKWRGELKQVNRDGGDVFVLGSATLVRDGQGQPSAVLAINTDITEMKTIEAQFLRAQRLEGIGTLASGVAHDLNNILAPILMVVPILQEALAGTRHERMVSTLETCAQRGADVVKQVLTFASGVTGERVLLQTGHLLREMEKIARETFPRAILVRNCAPHDLWPVTGDATQLHQVLLNLCVNARDAMPEGGTLTLDAENFELDGHYASMVPGAQAGPHLLLKISDTGTGIPREVMDKIFDPFFTTKGLGKGSGLGLSTVMGIVKSHGGFVNVQSEAGRGAIFEVFLPASPDAEPAAAAAADDAGPVPQGHGELILVTDDEAAIRDVMCAVLEKNGYQTLAAADGAEAIALYAQRRAEIGAVVTDLMMPHLDGLALSRALMRMNPDVRIVACTGLGEASRTTELRALGVCAILAKPHTAERLLRTLHEALEPASLPALAA